MLKRIAIVSGLVAAFGAQIALATPTLDLSGTPPMQSAREAQAVPQATNRAPERFPDSGARAQGPNAPFTWNP
jgi:hypothetical protein